MVGPEKPAAGETSTATTGSSAAEGSSASKPRRRPSFSVGRARTVVAQVVWIVCLVAATSLAVAALCIAVDANQGNGLVGLVLDLAGFFDLGVFTLDDGIMAFTGDNADTKNALVNYGLGAAFWLVLGRVLERLIRP
ncbi:MULTISPECIES: hypothetical protein [unclassified Nocardioides]|uniref:hypothetical protein n=1 Tax=unclassified Nocardioides TaxID=2615069 RepID=UPI00240515EC|nr:MULTISPECIES: hypothetical protein [unclassified Nocardioides]